MFIAENIQSAVRREEGVALVIFISYAVLKVEPLCVGSI